jgi:5'-3' exonuclease
MYFRAFFGVPESVTAPDGMPVNAVRGFCDMISTLLLRYRPTDLVACLDYDWRPAFRVELVPSYKAHRVAQPGLGAQPDVEEVPDPLSAQVPVILDVLSACGLCWVGAAGFEADDVIATLSRRFDAEAGAVDVVSGDRDLIAVATERVRVLYIGRGVAKLEEFTPAAVQSRYGVPPERYADMAVLRGDPSDGLPGARGIGDKTAAGLVRRFGSVEDIVHAARSGDPRLTASERAKLLASADYLAVAPAVVRGRTDVELPELSSRIPMTPADPAALTELAERYGLSSPLARLVTAMTAVGS